MNSVTGLLGLVVAVAALGAPFLRTDAGRRAFGLLAGTVDAAEDRDVHPDRAMVAATYAGFTAGYVGLVVLASDLAGDSGLYGRTLMLLLPFAFCVAAATTWLPSLGVDWRPVGRRTEATVAWTGFVAVVTVATTGGWLLVG
ncbi:hypothetical protein [Halobaculum sp. D14]|uniref:hypothetical protein n=1 Tax=unclassified Halobaculum TaxID=2640896 RepID=UPI003EB6DA3D